MTGPFSDCSPEPAIWLAHQTEQPLALPASWLSGAEQQTAARLSTARQQEYLHSRWLLRHALAQASGEAAEQCVPVPGRPTASLFPAGWRVSLSHSHKLAACATGTREVGVDIEPLSRRGNWQGIVRRWFTQKEQHWLLAADGKAGSDQFLAVWTLKEAWLKATGRGIAGNLQTLEVSTELQLRGDAVGPDWHAAVGTVGGFMVALVYRAAALQTPWCNWLERPSSANPVMSAASAHLTQVNWLTTTTINTGA